MKRKRRVDTAEQAKLVARDIQALLDAGKPALVTTEEYKPPKSSDQLAKLHALINDFAVSQSRPPDEMKILLKLHLGYSRTITKSNGETIVVPKSFADMSREDASEFIERLLVLATEYHVELKDAA